MKALNRALDRFCTKHPKFGIPNLMLFIVIGNIAVFFFNQMSRNAMPHNLSFIYYLYFSPSLILDGEVWRLITFLFVPNDSSLIFLVLSLYFYYSIGSTLEKQWGCGKFTLYYLTGVILLILFGFVLHLCKYFVLLDATYLNLSMFFAFATLFPEARVLLFFVVPIKIKWLALVDAALFCYAIITSSFPANLLPLVATLNFFIFCGGYLIDAFKPLKYKYSHQNVHFRQASQHTTHSQHETPYNRRCDVCGRTDISNPELEFRYCSRCAGYHCYCQDHINSHIHFTE